MLDHLRGLLEEYGYWVLFIGCFLEGEAVVLLSGYLAHQGIMSYWAVVLVAMCGACLGDQFFYYLGRWKGRPLLERKPTWRSATLRIENMMNRHKYLMLLGFRFLWGLRAVVPAAMGVFGIHPIVFLIFNILGAFLWAPAVAGLGFYLGEALQSVLSDMKRVEMLIAAVIVIGALVYWWRNRKKLAETAPPFKPKE